MKRGPSNSLIKPSGSSNNNPSGGGASGSGNNNASGSGSGNEASGSGNNNTAVAVARPGNNLPTNNSSLARPGNNTLNEPRNIIAQPYSPRSVGLTFMEGDAELRLRSLHDLNR